MLLRGLCVAVWGALSVLGGDLIITGSRFVRVVRIVVWLGLFDSSDCSEFWRCEGKNN